MQYFIHINQLMLAKTTLTLNDVVILDWLINICNSKNEKIEQQRIDGMTWINYSKILIDMPLLRSSSKMTITRSIKAIQNAGYIKTTRMNHQQLYAKLTEKVDTLIFTPDKKK